MSLTFYVTVLTSEGHSRPAEEGDISAPNWCDPNARVFVDGVTRALSDWMVAAMQQRNKMLESFEESDRQEMFWLDEHKERHEEVLRIRDLRDYWGNAGDGICWDWDNRKKVIDLLFEVLFIDGQRNQSDPFVERDRLAYVLRYLTSTPGDGVTLA